MSRFGLITAHTKNSNTVFKNRIFMQISNVFSPNSSQVRAIFCSLMFKDLKIRSCHRSIKLYRKFRKHSIIFKAFTILFHFQHAISTEDATAWRSTHRMHTLLQTIINYFIPWNKWRDLIWFAKCRNPVACDYIMKSIWV